MPRTYEQKIAYGRGYNAGVHGRWPEHRPPTPPMPVVAQLMEAAQQLRDAADCLCATFGDDDDVCRDLGSGIDRVDTVFEVIGKWLRDNPELAAAVESRKSVTLPEDSEPTS